MSMSWFGFIRTTSAASIATSVPLANEMPTLEVASAGESLIPSPTIATICPCFWRSSIIVCLPLGRTPAKTFSGAMPTSEATCFAVAAWSPVTNEVSMFKRCSASTQARAEGLRVSERPIEPA